MKRGLMASAALCMGPAVTAQSPPESGAQRPFGDPDVDARKNDGAYAGAIGHPVSEVLSIMASRDPGRAVRVVRKGDQMTMDMVASRITIVVDEHNIVIRIYRG